MRKEITVDPQIFEKIMDSLYHYMRRWRQGPTAILLGPNEWLSFRIQLEQQHRFEATQRPIKFQGLEVRPKTARGIDFEIPEELVRHFAIGELQTSGGGDE